MGSAMSGCSRPEGRASSDDSDPGPGVWRRMRSSFSVKGLQLQLGPTDTAQVPRIQAHECPVVIKAKAVKDCYPASSCYHPVSISCFRQASRC